jgi:hypothetical protein
MQKTLYERAFGPAFFLLDSSVTEWVASSAFRPEVLRSLEYYAQVRRQAEWK